MYDYIRDFELLFLMVKKKVTLGIAMDTQKSFILFTAETAPTYAGDGLNALLFAKTLLRKGYTARIICLNANGLLPKTEEINTVRIDRVRYWCKTKVGRFLLRLSIVLTILRIWRCGNYWLIYGAMPSHRVIVLVGKLLRRRIIFRSTLLDFDDIKTLTESKSRLVFRLNKYLYKQVSGYYALNSQFLSRWESVFHKAIPVFKSTQGVDFSNVISDANGNTYSRNVLGLPQSVPVILMLGHLINRKGFPEIFQLLSKVKSDFLLVHIGRHSAPSWDIMYTKNSEMAKNKQMGHELLGSRVAFIGETDNVRDYMRVADIYLLNSEAEGFPPNSLNEAMANGLAILAKRIRGSEDVLEDEHNALLFNNSDEFEGKLIRMLEDVGLRERLGANARKFALEKNDINTVVDNYINFVNTLG